MKNAWKVWIDTGGTFTDCIAVSPSGNWLRAKVLSSGSLRGTIRKKTGPRLFQFQHQWPFTQSIFKGYELRLLDHPDRKAIVQEVEFEQACILLDQDLDIPGDSDFEISAHEEAPLLAIRLVTNTPLNKPLPPIQLRLGTTKGTNALLEGKGARTTLLITKGLADLLYIGTQQRPHLFQLDIPEPALIQKSVIEVDERLDANGNVLKPLTETETQHIIQRLKASEAEVVAIALLHAYANPIHERQLEQAIRQAGFKHVSISSSLSPTIQLLPRANTALVNAYLDPVIQEYLQNIQAAFSTNVKGSSIQVMTSAGGLAGDRLFQPKDSLLSGPAGGVVGAAKVGEHLGIPRLLTLDMGGTSTDTARYDRAFDYAFTTQVGPYSMRNPALAIETVAAGGGSICHFDGFRLAVGPESAGAFPGPACYGAGGPLTITDVNLLLGKFAPAFMGIPVRVEKARQALLDLQAQIERTTGYTYSEEELLTGFERIANEKMADAIRRISVAKGFSPSAYSLLVFGGAGGLHACKIAELLHVQSIILPFDSGLLSAYGIGHAEIEKLLDKQILQPLEDCFKHLPDYLRALKQDARHLLIQEDIPEEQIHIRDEIVFLRFQGQDHVLGIPYHEKHENLLAAHRQKYQRLFGHYPEGRPLEVERIQVLVRSDTASQQTTPPTTKAEQQLSQVNAGDIPVLDWGNLSLGQSINGPAILCNPYATAFVEPGWSGEVQSGGNILLKHQTAGSEEPLRFQEVIELELFANRFTGIAMEMGALLQRSAFSVNIKERLDFSCAILDRNAKLLVNAPHIPVHLGSLGICARLVLESFPLEEGDVIITNHPKYGGSHLPDITLIAPVYSEDHQLIGYVVNRAHHAEIGGKSPGSMPPDAVNLAEEGVVIAPSYLVKGELVQWERIEKLFGGGTYPTRSLPENLADINAGLAALRIGQEKLKALAQKHGMETLHYYMDKLKHQAAETLGEALAPYLGKTFSAEELLDDGNRIQAHVSIQEENIHFDFSGTSGVHPQNLNANIAIVYSVVIYVLRLLCQKDIPLNEGLMEKVDITLPQNSLLHPDFEDDPARCPAVVGGNTEVSQRLTDTLLKALNLAACSQGTMNNFLFGNDRFGYYETIAGGCGAGPGFNGRSGIHQHMTNTKITDPEVLEKRFPVRLHQFALRQDSGGEGKWKGGEGIIREVEFLEPVKLTILSQHRKEAPYGLEDGSDGLPGKNLFIRKNGIEEELNSTDQREAEAGDRIRIFTPGGGGWGQP